MEKSPLHPLDSVVKDDGLRCKSKQSGSPFSNASSFSNSAMSCFMCGKHRSRAYMITKRIFGKSQMVCTPSCKDVDAALKASASGV